MSLDLETQLKVFYASAPQNVWKIETLEISHSAMTQTFYLWREPYVGVTYVDGVARTMRAANFKADKAGSQGHLDQVFNISLDLTDAEDEFREQMDLIPIDTDEKALVTFREYMSDDLENPQSSARLEVENVAWNKGVASISAASPRLNMTRTGELYSPKAVPMLRGFL